MPRAQGFFLSYLLVVIGGKIGVKKLQKYCYSFV
jgi:hypothetical protein